MAVARCPLPMGRDMGSGVRLSWMAKMKHDAKWEVPRGRSASLMAVLGIARAVGNGQDWTTQQAVSGLGARKGRKLRPDLDERKQSVEGN